MRLFACEESVPIRYLPTSAASTDSPTSARSLSQVSSMSLDCVFSESFSGCGRYIQTSKRYGGSLSLR